MRFVATRDALCEVLQKVMGIVPVRSVMDILTNLLLKVDKRSGKIRLTVTDLEIGITAVANLDKVEQGGSVTLPAKKFHEIIRELPEGEITISSDENNVVTLTSGRSKISLKGRPKDEYPDIPMVGDEIRWKMDQDLLRNMIRRTLFASAQEEARSYLNGSNIIVGDGMMEMIATDGHRLAYTKTEISSPPATALSVIVPAKALLEIQKNLDDEGKIEIKSAGNQIGFETGDFSLVSRLISEQFPDYDRVIPKAHERTIWVGVEDLYTALRRVSILASDRSNSVKISVSRNTLRLSAEAPEIGTADDELEARTEGEGIEMAFKARYLLDFLKAVQGGELRIDLSKPKSPGLFRVEGEEHFKYIVMPMRL